MIIPCIHIFTVVSFLEYMRRSSFDALVENLIGGVPYPFFREMTYLIK